MVRRERPRTGRVDDRRHDQDCSAGAAGVDRSCEHREQLAPASLRDLFGRDSHRAATLTREHSGLIVDLSKNLITATTLSLLCDLARAAGVEQRRDRMLAGQAINSTEGRSVLHVRCEPPPRTSTWWTAGTWCRTCTGCWNA